MSAKEMFEELGYIWNENNDYIKYKKVYWEFIFPQVKNVYFWKGLKEISVFYNTIDLQEFKAIQKQIEELGW